MYVLVKETGEYSGFDYQVICYYETEKEAEQASEALRYENELQLKVKSARSNYRDYAEFKVLEVQHGKNVVNLDKGALRAKYEPLLEEAKREWEQKQRENQERIDALNRDFTKKFVEKQKVRETLTLQDEIRTIIHNVLKEP